MNKDNEKNDTDKDNKEQQQQMQQMFNEITSYAIRLYDLMQHGMTIELTFPDPNGIVIPNQPPKLRRLLITKPKLHVSIQVPNKC
ncbi:MAG: hypothetical protein WCI77_07990 [Candidatus Omnitrophota bacterium]